MLLTLNIIVLILEILFYSLFMKFARIEGKFVRYILAFTMVTLLTGICNIQTIFAYIIIVFSMLLSLKYVVKLKTSMYDLLFIFIMILVKLIIELSFYILFSKFTSLTVFYVIMQLGKIANIFVLREVINLSYKSLKIKWDNNNFYIRYIFTTFMFLYFIFAALYLIVFYI